MPADAQLVAPPPPPPLRAPPPPPPPRAPAPPPPPPARRATLFFLGDGHVRGVVAINNARELKLARKWMNQGRAVDREALADTTKALA
ncbi:oxidoreductase C-terminal domain-containing protein [Burkholderia multivorans]|uniref:oxidoreductase C-terminal domain-containing protein n=1 Tax=Burkholderia multivorans TaxID=87883 RepID=UPI003F4A680B